MGNDHQVLFGDTPEHAWMLEFADRCFPESGDRITADYNLAMAMCKAEPKIAQFAMQIIAQKIRSRNDDKPDITFMRFQLGVLFTAYVRLALAEGRCAPGELPAEVHFAVRFNPEIIECTNELGEINLQVA